MSIMTIGLAAAHGDLAAYIFTDIESVDRHWEARYAERYLGLYDSLDEDDEELARVAILGCLAGEWFVATCLVDGEGAVHDMTGRIAATSRTDADRLYGILH